MDVDLCDQRIFELVFDPATTSSDERLVASTVECLRAERNQIHRISGLGSAFANLTTLLLRENNLGQSSAAPHDALRRARSCPSGSRLCEGVPTWIAALPASLRTLDVSYNHLRSFLHCTCNVSTALVSAAADATVAADAPCQPGPVDRFLRHACPLALSLFFPRERFPFLAELKVTNNAFACSLRESQAMEDLWEGQATDSDRLRGGGRYTAIRALDIADCPGLFAVNPFVLATAPTEAAACALESVRACATGVNDLTGVSALGFYTPQVTALNLSSTPICGDLLHANATALSDFLEDMIRSMASPATDSADAAQPALTAALAGAAHDLAFHHVNDLARSMDLIGASASTATSPPPPPLALLRHKEAPEGPLTTLRSCVYALLLHTVIPSLKVADEALSIEACHQALVEAALSTLAMTPALTPSAPSTQQPAAVTTVADDNDDTVDAPRTTPSTLPNWSTLAAHAGPDVRARVLLPDGCDADGETADTASEDSIPQIVSTESVGRYQQALAALQPALGRTAAAAAQTAGTATRGAVENVPPASESDAEDEGDSVLFVPSRLSGTDKLMFEELSREAASLHEKLTASREARRALVGQTDQLREQLTADRLLVRDQRQEVLRLRAARDELAGRTAGQRALLAKRRKEVSYGARAIESKEAAARNRDVMAELQAQQRAGRQRQRTLQRAASQNSNFSVQYAHAAPPAVQPRKTRSDVLREEAIQQRMALHAAAEGPFTYEPKPFRSRGPAVPSPLTHPPPQPPSPKSPEQLEEEYLGLYERHVPLADLPPRRDDRPLPPPPPPPLSAGAGGGGDMTGVNSEGEGVAASPAEPWRLSASFPASPPSVGSSSPDPVTSSLPLVEKDLSTLSLTELFEAAAAVRRKQLALQELHQHWAAGPPDAGAATSPSDARVGAAVAVQPAAAPAQRVPAQTSVNDDEAVNRALFDSSIVQ